MHLHVLMLMLSAFAGTLAADSASAQAARPGQEQKPSAPAAATSPRQEATTGRAEQEAGFARIMQNVVLEGHWRMTEAGDDKSSTRLSNPRPERYQVVSATKLQADTWLITARIQYASHDVNLPVTVRVVWAGDTPVITVDEITLPVLGTYSARVMIYHDAYAGIWHGGGHGGVMSGTIRPHQPPSKETAPTGGADASTPE